MRSIFLLGILVLILMTTAAYAEKAEQAGDIKTLCDVLEKYTKPTGAQGADYVAGVDVHGNSVVSADVSGSSAAASHPVRIPIEFDLAQKYGLTQYEGIYMKPEVAMIEVSPDGHVKYDGKDISAQARSSCKNSSTPEVAHGQDAAHDIISQELQQQTTVPQSEEQGIIGGVYPQSSPPADVSVESE